MYLDLILIAVMLISGLLAMVRGFMREVLSIVAWGAAAIATLFAYSRLLPYAREYFNNEYVAAGVTIGGVFLLTLIVVSALTVRLSDRVLDSRIGALDRTLGFLFGLGRGLLIVVVAFIFFDWLVPARSQPEGLRDARSRVVLEGTGQWLMSLLPEDPEKTILRRLRRQPDDEETPERPPGQRSDWMGDRLEVAAVSGETATKRRVLDECLRNTPVQHPAMAA